MKNYWGYQLLLDCSGCGEGIKNRDVITSFVKELIERIDMVAHGDPVIEFLCPGDDDKAGYSLMQLITTSSIVGHFIDATSTAYIDIFSCKTFEITTVQEVVDKYFTPTQMRVTFLTRQAS